MTSVSDYITRSEETIFRPSLLAVAYKADYQEKSSQIEMKSAMLSDTDRITYNRLHDNI